MSVVVIIKFPGGKVDKFKEAYARHADTMTAVSAEARGKGAVHHMFVEDENGDMMVIDEWGSMAEFDAFFAAQEDIKAIVGEIGLTGPPTAASYSVIDTTDRF